jgi:hypothetical protein
MRHYGRNSAADRKSPEATHGQNTFSKFARSPSGQSNAAVDREARLDRILLALWQGRLSAEAAADRIMAKLGLSECVAQAEVDGFLKD